MMEQGSKAMEVISIDLVDENDRLVSHSPLNFADILYGVVFSLDKMTGKEKYPWLYSVDPCGKTLFDMEQIPTVIAELQALLEEHSAQRHRETINEMIVFFCRARRAMFIRLSVDG